MIKLCALIFLKYNLFILILQYFIYLFGLPTNVTQIQKKSITRYFVYIYLKSITAHTRFKQKYIKVIK